jgi:hypothetical protein
MKQPDWFIIIKEWRDNKMGEFGVTLPFIYGALQMKYGSIDIREVIQEMIAQPVPGYVIEITWCPDALKAPVLRATKEISKDRVTFQVETVQSPSTGKPALVFDNDLVRMWQSQDLVEALIQDAHSAIELGKFSRRHDDSTGKYFYDDFSEKEIRFIKSSIMTSSC